MLPSFCRAYANIKRQGGPFWTAPILADHCWMVIKSVRLADLQNDRAMQLRQSSTGRRKAICSIVDAVDDSTQPLPDTKRQHEPCLWYVTCKSNEPLLASWTRTFRDESLGRL